MRCDSCGSEWKSPFAVEKCPFCGAALEKEKPERFDDIPSAVSYAMEKEGADILLSPDVLIAYVMDLVPRGDRQKKLFRLGCDYGVTKQVYHILEESRANRREVMALNLKRDLIDGLFMSEKNASELLELMLKGAGLSPLIPAPGQTSETIPVYQPNKSNSANQIIAIAAGGFHTVGLRADGTVVAAGNNRLGQCNVSDWRHMTAVCAGRNHTVGLLSDGTVTAVGSNALGGCDVEDWRDIVAVSANENHTAGLKADGTVIAVRYDTFGKSRVSDWRDIVAISAGLDHLVGLRADGTVTAAGYNAYGQCSLSGWRNIIDISAGSYHTVGLRADGTVAAVGKNTFGECDVGGWQDMVAVSAGSFYTIGLRSDGVVMAKGNNASERCNFSGW